MECEYCGKGIEDDAFVTICEECEAARESSIPSTSVVGNMEEWQMGNKIAYVEAEVRPGQRLVQSLTYDTPTQFVSCQRVGIGGRKWWQFWKPRAVNVVTRFKNVANENKSAAR